MGGWRGFRVLSRQVKDGVYIEKHYTDCFGENALERDHKSGERCLEVIETFQVRGGGGGFRMVVEDLKSSEQV